MKLLQRFLRWCHLIAETPALFRDAPHQACTISGVQANGRTVTLLVGCTCGREWP